MKLILQTWQRQDGEFGWTVTNAEYPHETLADGRKWYPSHKAAREAAHQVACFICGQIEAADNLAAPLSQNRYYGPVPVPAPERSGKLERESMRGPRAAGVVD